MITGGRHGPGWRVMDADPRGAGEIRDWIRSAIAGHGCPVDPDDAALAAGELFVNALMHGPSRGKALAGYCLWREGARIVVCDGGSPGAPVLRETGTGTEGGRGLHLVQELPARWGSFRLPGARVVRCDLGQPLRAPASDARAWLQRVLPACPLAASTRPVAARVPGSRLPRDTMNSGPDRPALPRPVTAGRAGPVLRLVGQAGGTR